MMETLYHGRRVRLLTIIDEGTDRHSEGEGPGAAEARRGALLNDFIASTASISGPC